MNIESHKGQVLLFKIIDNRLIQIIIVPPRAEIFGLFQKGTLINPSAQIVIYYRLKRRLKHFHTHSQVISGVVHLFNELQLINMVSEPVVPNLPGGQLGITSRGFFALADFFELADFFANLAKAAGESRYLDEGLRELGFGRAARVIAVAFALMCIGGSLGGGNMFQAWNVGTLTETYFGIPSIASGIVLFAATWALDHRFTPEMDADLRAARYDRWRRAVKAVMSF